MLTLEMLSEQRNSKQGPVSTPTPSTTVDKDEDDALSYFQKLAES